MKLVEAQWRPRVDTAGFVELDRRSYNTLADHAANVALDLQSGWEDGSTTHCSRCLCERVRLHLSTDVATRANGRASAEMAVIVHRQLGEAEVAYRAGKVLGTLPSAFNAETLALDWALAMLEGMIGGWHL